MTLNDDLDCYSFVLNVEFGKGEFYGELFIRTANDVWGSPRTRS